MIKNVSKEIAQKNNEVIQKTKGLRIATFVLYVVCTFLFLTILIIGLVLLVNKDSSESGILSLPTIIISGFFLLIYAILMYKAVRLIKPKDQRVLQEAITLCFALFMVGIFFGVGLIFIALTMTAFLSSPSDALVLNYGLILVSIEGALLLSSIAGVIVANIAKKKNSTLVNKEEKQIVKEFSSAHDAFAYSDTLAENKRLKQELAELENKELKKKIDELKSKKD